METIGAIGSIAFVGTWMAGLILMLSNLEEPRCYGQYMDVVTHLLNSTTVSSTSLECINVTTQQIIPTPNEYGPQFFLGVWLFSTSYFFIVIGLLIYNFMAKRTQTIAADVGLWQDLDIEAIEGIPLPGTPGVTR